MNLRTVTHDDLTERDAVTAAAEKLCAAMDDLGDRLKRKGDWSRADKLRIARAEIERTVKGAWR